MFVLMGTLLLSGCNAKTEENPQQSTEASDTVNTSVTEIDTSDSFQTGTKKWVMKKQKALPFLLLMEVLPASQTLCLSQKIQ